MKIVAAVVALVAVLLLALPPALGTLTESRVRERITAINGNGVLVAEIKSFDRGWFASRAKIEIGLSPAYLAQLRASGGPVDVVGQHATIAVDFAHGPVAVQRGVHLGWSTMVARLDPETPGLAQIEQQLGVPYIFEFRGRTGLGGGVAFDADVPPMDVPAGGTQVKFSGATLDGTYASNQLVSNARIESFELASPTGIFLLRNLRATTDLEILSQNLAPGNAELSIESVSALDPLQGSTPIFQADQLKLTSGMSRNAAGTLLDMQLNYGLNWVRVAGSEVSDAALGFVVHDIDVLAFEHYSQTVRQVATSATSPDPQAALAALAPDIERVLAAKPRLVIDPIRFKFNGEPFEGRAEVTTDPANLPPGGVANLDPSVMLGLVSSNADIKLSKALARRLAGLAAEMQFRGDSRMPPEQLRYMAEAQAGLMLVQLVSLGFLLEDGEVYRATLRYAGGVLTVNDKPLPFGPQ